MHKMEDGDFLWKKRRTKPVNLLLLRPGRDRLRKRSMWGFQGYIKMIINSSSRGHVDSDSCLTLMHEYISVDYGY